MTPRQTAAASGLLLACVSLVGCGGGGSNAVVPPPGSAPTDAQRIAAATRTAQTSTQCVGGPGGTDIRPFYWEIGDRSAARAAGSVPDSGRLVIAADTRVSIASASKWYYSSYWIERIGGGANLSPADIAFFNFTSGYTQFLSCGGDPAPDPTVASCLAVGSNGDLDASTVGYFDYGGGHMQVHAATVAGLGGLDDTALAQEINARLGTRAAYGEPHLAGGIFTSAADYATLLRGIVGGRLQMRSALGSHPVCTDPDTCPTAIGSPSPRGEQWHYSIGHWVEDDPQVGDGAFSSPGAFGFYPWIDASRSYYGIVSRVALGGAIESVACGRLIRKAWLTGVAQ